MPSAPAVAERPRVLGDWRRRVADALPDGKTLPEAEFLARHRGMVALLWAHVAALPILSLVYGYGIGHSALEGAAVAVFAVPALAPVTNRRLATILVTFGLLTASAVLVHITRGLIESHFHFFVMVTVLSLYQDWTPFLLSIGYVLLHHGVGSVIDHASVFDHAGTWKWAGVHALFISGLSAANLVNWRAAEKVRAEQEAAFARLAQANAELDARASDLARSNAELEQFAYVASHDLSEPLRMVTSYLQLIEMRYRGSLDAEADEFIDYAVGGATRMRALLDDLLVYSRAGRVELDTQPVDLSHTLAMALNDLSVAIGEAGAVVRVGDLPTVDGDPVQLRQLFQNLIANAIKFHADQPPVVEVSAERSGENWHVAVADNGIGINPEHSERIFKMFHRLHARDEFGGTGVGLAVCRLIADRHQGRIWCEPNPGGGSRFVVELAGA